MFYCRTKMATTFHSRTGSCVILSNGGKTACRNHPSQEFNNGIVFSSSPLQPNKLFEIMIEKKVSTWSGSVEIGVVSSDPATIDLPTSAGQLRDGAWIMSGSSIIKNGQTILEDYGASLDLLSEGDKVGMMLTSSGSLHFFINGVDQGSAFDGVPSRVHGVVDLYGKCSQVSLVDSGESNHFPILVGESPTLQLTEHLAFHEHCGLLIRLSNGNKTAERRSPMDEFNNGVVMSNRPLRNSELFEIRIDRLVDKWSGSLEIGVTTHNPACVEFPATMTNMRSGTIMMSSSGILTNGRGVRRAFANYNLEELREGSRIGLMKKVDGSVHFFINGVDQGAADTQVSGMVWGVVDLYGMVVKVTLMDPNEVRGSAPYAITDIAPVSADSSNTNVSNSNQLTSNASENRHVTSDSNMAEVRLSPMGRVETMERQIHRYLQLFRDLYMEAQIAENNQETGPLLFNTRCGCHAAVINTDRTAHRPNALDDFNNAVVLTNRHLRPGELFEIRLDKVIDKWAGSVEIGVTTHSPLTLDFPSTMTNIRSGTWMMTGTGVMQNGVTVIDEYGCSLDTLRVGDRVGVMRKESGTLHFYVNGLDQGPAASNVPLNVYGVIDLYGQAAQATIIDHTPQEPVSRVPASQDLVFHRSYGHNVLLTNEDRTASRPPSSSESSGTCVLSSRPLADDELFDVSIDLFTGDTGSGTLAAGVTLLDTDRQAQRSHGRPNTGHTWMLSGNVVRKDGHDLLTQAYGLNLDLAPAGSRLSIVRRADGSLHFLLNNIDYGVAATGIPLGVYAIVDLCGQCSQVTIGPSTGHLVTSSQTDNQLTGNSLTEQHLSSLSLPLQSEARSHKLSTCCGKNVAFKNDQLTACRVHGHDCGLVFSSQPLHDDELFEVKIDAMSPLFTGSLLIGLTSLSLDDMGQVSLSVARATELVSSCVTWVAMETSIYRNGSVSKYNCLPSLSRLVVGSRVGVKRSSEGHMHLVINGTDYGPVASDLPQTVYAVVDIGGRVEQVTVTSTCDSVRTHNTHALVTLASADSSCDSLRLEDGNSWHGVHGANVEVLSGEQSGAARRVSGFSDALLFSKYPLTTNKMTCLRLDELDSQWESSVRVGVTSVSAEKQRSVSSAVNLRQCWLLQGSCLLHGATKVREGLPVNLDSLSVGDVIGLTLDEEGSVHLSINGVDRGVAMEGLPPSQPHYLVADVYGRCRQLSLVSADKPVGEANSQVPPSSGVLRKSLDSDSGLKEKINRSKQQMEPQKMRRNCRYLALCLRARAMLGLPDGYFSGEAGRCHCEACHKASGDATVVSQGEPCRDFMVPVGWARFALRRQAKAEQLCKKWHTAYHTCLARCVRRVLDTGNLNAADEATELRCLQQPVSYDEKAEGDGEDKTSGHKMMLLSPVISCLNSDTPPLQYVDPVTGRQCVAEVALQVSVKPGSYKTNTPKKVDSLKDKIDARFSKHELEWWTKETGAVVISALLIRVQ